MKEILSEVWRERILIAFVVVCLALTSISTFMLFNQKPCENSIHINCTAIQIQEDEDLAWRIFNEILPAYEGQKYEWRVFDCSWFTRDVYETFLGAPKGVVPRTSVEQCRPGLFKEVQGTPLPGDLGCYDWEFDGKIDHVTIYAGKQHVIQNSTSRNVCLEKINAPWLAKGFVKWVRVIGGE